MKSLTISLSNSALLCLLNPKVWTVAQNLTELFNILYFFSLGKKSHGNCLEPESRLIFFCYFTTSSSNLKWKTCWCMKIWRWFPNFLTSKEVQSELRLDSTALFICLSERFVSSSSMINPGKGKHNLQKQSVPTCGVGITLSVIFSRLSTFHLQAKKRGKHF